MSRILIFAGTSEGRKLSEWLCERNTEHDLCVATEYGEQVLGEHPCAKVFRGRMDEEQIGTFMADNRTELVVDATHPYAKIVTENIKNAAEKANTRYIRLDRNSEDNTEISEKSGESSKKTGESADKAADRSGEPVRRFFRDASECAKALKKTKGNILLTTGSKELHIYCENEDLRARIIARVLPGKESIALCEKSALPGKQIIAMQGPFSVEMNRALIHAYDIKIMVSKLSGKTGGYFEKEQAAFLEHVQLYLIGRPENSPGLSFSQVTDELRPYTEQKARTVTLIGCGMGHRESMTKEALDALAKAEIVFGAKRLLADVCGVKAAEHLKEAQYLTDGELPEKTQIRYFPYYLAKDVCPVIKETQGDAVILFSGDTGFYSGAAKMYEALKKELPENHRIKILPGISSVSNLSALTGIGWEDAKIFSVHGKGTFENWAGKFLSYIRTNRKTFLLLSGVRNLNEIGRALRENGLEYVRIICGYQMSYPEERVMALTPSECEKVTEEGLYALFLLNEDVQSPQASHGLPDSEFIRAKVPMTKEEVREVSISKLHLKKNSVVYDIGSGTGSIAIEIAGLSPDIKVYAVERKPEAVELIKENIRKFGLFNIQVVESYAPEGLENLEKPTHAFIGGTGGKMKEILKALFDRNGNIRVCANAVSIETFEELTAIEKEFPVKDFGLVSLAATRTKTIGGYRMMQAENPIWICSFTADPGKEE